MGYHQWTGKCDGMCDSCDCHLHPSNRLKANTQEAHTAAAVSRIYVTCHQCDSCQHIGINDPHPTESACNRGACGWHGPTPAEDLCPGCGESGTMSEACPRCGGHYALLADADLVPTEAA